MLGIRKGAETAEQYWIKHLRTGSLPAYLHSQSAFSAGCAKVTKEVICTHVYDTILQT